MKLDSSTLESAASNVKSAENNTSARMVRKPVIARQHSVSKRLVDHWVASGCPHVKPSSRLCLFDPDEVTQWLKDKFGVRRRGPAQAAAKAVEGR